MSLTRQFRIGQGRITFVDGDITRQAVDVIVNAANSRLAGGGGVDGAIHRVAGPELMEACREIGGCPTGSAVITPGFRLLARFVIHAVGPLWAGGQGREPDHLRSAYQNSLRIAREEGLRTIAFPSLSTGAYGYPMKDAAGIAIGAAAGHLRGQTSLSEIRFVLFGEDAWRTFVEAAVRLLPATPDQEAGSGG